MATLFSTLLINHVTAKNIKTPLLAQYCNMDRSNMYKILKGKRNPASKDIVHKMADFMRLTPIERHELLESYEITLTGYDNFYRRKDVQEFIQYFTEKLPEFPSVYTDFSSALLSSEHSDSIFLTGKYPIDTTLRCILSAESKKRHGHLKLIFQPEHNYMDILIAAVKNQQELTIEHIICLNNNSTITAEKRDYNLSCLKKLIPIYTSCSCKYIPLYYYDSILTRDSIFTLFSSAIITSDYVLTFSPELESGILFYNKQLQKHFHTLFNRLKSETKPLVYIPDSIFSQFNYFNQMDIHKASGFSFQKEPCLIPLLPAFFPEKYITKNLPNRELFITTVKRYIRQSAASFKGGLVTFFFTENGIRHFLNTGRISELPDSLYEPVDLNDRYLLLHNLITACQEMNYIMLRPETPITSSNLCVFAASQIGYLLFHSSDNKLVYLNLEEPSLMFAFHDYLESLYPVNCYSTEETVERLTKLTQRIQKRITPPTCTHYDSLKLKRYCLKSYHSYFPISTFNSVVPIFITSPFFKITGTSIRILFTNV